MKDLSIILSIYDRGDYCNFLENWFRYAMKYLTDYKIFITNGSRKEEIYSFFNENEFQNKIDFEYIQYPKDKNFNNYFAKLDDV